MPMNLFELAAASVSPRWNQKFREQIAALYNDNFRLPEIYKKDLLWLENAAGANAEAIIYGGGVLDIKLGRKPKDLDTYIVSKQHPLIAMARVGIAALSGGIRIGFYDHRKKGIAKTVRVTLAWKRMKLFREGRIYDIGFLSAPFDTIKLADDPDINICAIAATRKGTVVSERHKRGLKNKTIEFRSTLGDARARRRNPERVRRYAIEKFPGWPVRYADPEDAQYFKPFLKSLGLD